MTREIFALIGFRFEAFERNVFMNFVENTVLISSCICFYSRKRKTSRLCKKKKSILFLVSIFIKQQKRIEN